MSLIFNDGTPFMNSSWKTLVGNKLIDLLAILNPSIQLSAFLAQHASDMRFLGFEAAKKADDALKYFDDLLSTQRNNLYNNLQGNSFSPNEIPSNKITPKSVVDSIIDNNKINNTKDNTRGKKFTGKFLGLDAAGWGLAFDIARSVLPENRAYLGEEGNLARGLDTAYNGLSDAVSMFGPVGTLAGTIMKGGAFLNLGIAALGGGTDGMTKTDAILNSNFLGWTPLGLVNGLAGSRADKYSRDMLIDAETNGSYGGFLNLEDESDKVSGKKYGLFSQGAKNAANNLVLKTTALLISLGNIEDTNRTNLMAALGNTPFISNRILLDYSGGVRQALVGRDGLKFAKRVISKAKVKKVLDESTNKTVTIPTDLTNDLKMGREPIITSDGKTVYMTGDGNVVSKIKKALEGLKLGYKLNMSEDDIKKKLEEDFPALKNLNIKFVADPKLNRKTAGGDIEYIRPGSSVLYLSGLKVNNPYSDAHTIVYNPYKTDYLDILLDSLHALRYGDPEYLKLINALDSYVLLGEDDLTWNARRRYDLDVKNNNGMEFDPYEDYVKNEVDGLLRSLFFEGSAEERENHNYAPDKSQLQRFNKHLLPYVSDIYKYITGGKDYVPSSDYPKIIQSKEAYYDPSSNTIYYTNDESKTHEYNHFSPNYLLIDLIGDYYKNLTDYKILELGGDLNFVKRTSDPSNFYSPEELAARLVTALKMSEGNKYTKDFFKTLRQDENKYGDNMRDLLHMYNDDNLVKLFEITNKYNRENPLEVQTFLNSYKDGGKVNVIPEGALHAHKHHLEEVDEKFEDVTTKGIPVVTESKDGGLVQLAEVEKEEIIFRLDVTKKLEELKKKGTDEAAIEAGKLLVHEILHNTVDNADLIEKTN